MRPTPKCSRMIVHSDEALLVRCERHGTERCLVSTGAGRLTTIDAGGGQMIPKTLQDEPVVVFKVRSSLGSSGGLYMIFY
jgi:hypothetical protein